MDEIRLIAVPGGVRGTGAAARAIVRVLVVPRLHDDGLVADSAMADWPTRLAGLAFEVRVRRDPADVPRVVAHSRDDDARPEVWEGLFGRRIGIEVHPTTPPSYGPADGPKTSEQAEQIDHGYATAAQAMAGPSGPASPEAAAAVAATIERFDEQPDVAAPPPPPRPAAPIEFHGVLARLREHPAVLRALGLIVELRMAVADLDEAAGTSAAQISVGCAGLGALAVSPWTRFERAPGRFLPASTDDVRNGMVDLAGAGPVGRADGGRWALTTVDVDGGALRLSQAAAGRGERSPSVEPEELPTLRSAGVVLLRRDRQDAFNARRRRADDGARRTVADLELDADDLLLGYRIDVKDAGRPWRSLHQRRAAYLVDGQPIRPRSIEEGHVKAFAATTTDGGATLRTDEVVARWNGWSLAVEPLDLAGTRGDVGRRRRADVPFDFDWTFDVAERSLPELRFGHAYRVRVRAADIAGGGLGLSDPVADAGASDPIGYARYEPIGPPHVEPPAELSPGESATRFVIRSDPATGLDAEGFARRFPSYAARRELAMSPPRTTLQIAEQHGFLDGDDEATWQAASRVMRVEDGGGLPDPAAEGVVVRLAAGPGGPTTSSMDDRAWAGTWPVVDDKVLRLVESTDLAGEVASINWVDDATLELALRRATEVTIELSSILRAGLLDHFEIRRWLEAFPPTAASSGRHPMVTPSSVLRLVHAVRKPLRTPSGSLALRPPEPGGTNRTFDAVLDIDTASTGSLDVSATWTEWRDDPAVGAPERIEVTDPAIARIPVPLGPFVAPPIHHELGDTRHRRVTYTVTAVSRFRDCFDAGPDDAFLDAGALPAVSTTSSARPPAPSVVATTPAWRWEPPEMTVGPSSVGGPLAWTTWRRVRHADRLRVTLARPWFATGDDERLAVVVVASSAPPDAALQPFVSWLARDPAVGTPAPARWVQADALAGAAAEGPQSVELPEAGGALVTVVPYEVTFAADGHWHADVDLGASAGTSYGPFVQLALARYQPSSTGVAVSTVVRSDIVNLPPRRELMIERAGRSVTVTLSGTAAASLVEVRVEQAATAPTSDLTVLDPGAGAGAGASWTRVSGLGATGAVNVALPAIELPAGVRLRIVVREIAASSTDPSDISDVPELVQRSVFIEQVELPPLP